MLSLLLVISAVLEPCAEHPASVVVDAGTRKLHLCSEDGTLERTYAVSLGRGGLDKHREGDAKTPLGSYPLGRPRPSGAGFDTFIPIAYPTPEQRAEGRTGGAIGIHGPPASLHEVLTVTAVSLGNWTLGCIAVARVAEIRAIAKWVTEHEIDRVHLLGSAKAPG